MNRWNVSNVASWKQELFSLAIFSIIGIVNFFPPLSVTIRNGSDTTVVQPFWMWIITLVILLVVTLGSWWYWWRLKSELESSQAIWLLCYLVGYILFSAITYLLNLSFFWYTKYPTLYLIPVLGLAGGAFPASILLINTIREH